MEEAANMDDADMRRAMRTQQNRLSAPKPKADSASQSYGLLTYHVKPDKLAFS